MSTVIAATQVKALRDKTGISMGDCKKALVEANGDEAQAMEILQKKFAGQMEMRANKEAANGRIGAYADGKVGALIELRCETDFVANNDDFKAAANCIAEIAARSGITDPEQLLNTKGPDGRTAQDIMTTAYSTLKENMQLARAACIDNAAACYVHHNGLVGTIIAASGDGGEIAKQICWHIAAQKVLEGLTRADIPKDSVEQARKTMKEQAGDKPPQIADKIVDGKMNKWFGERILPEQPFLPGDGKETVGEVAGKAGITLTGYLKFELGEKA